MGYYIDHSKLAQLVSILGVVGVFPVYTVINRLAKDIFLCPLLDNFLGIFFLGMELPVKGCD